MNAFLFSLLGVWVTCVSVDGEIQLFGQLSAFLILIAGWFSFGPGIPSKTQAKTVTVGVVSQSKQDAAIWKSVAQTAKDKYGITIKIKNFTDYNQPNKALKSGDVDLNASNTTPSLKHGTSQMVVV